MAETMTEEELTDALEGAEAVKDGGYDAATSGDEDDYVFATLYKKGNGRYFRHITTSGMNSPYDGGMEIGEWLDLDEVDRWDDFD